MENHVPPGSIRHHGGDELSSELASVITPPAQTSCLPSISCFFVYLYFSESSIMNSFICFFLCLESNSAHKRRDLRIGSKVSLLMGAHAAFGWRRTRGLWRAEAESFPSTLKLHPNASTASLLSVWPRPSPWRQLWLPWPPVCTDVWIFSSSCFSYGGEVSCDGGELMWRQWARDGGGSCAFKGHSTVFSPEDEQTVSQFLTFFHFVLFLLKV